MSISRTPRQIAGQSRQRCFYTFGGGTKRRSSLAPALAQACAVPGVGVEVPMDERGRPLTAGGISYRSPVAPCSIRGLLMCSRGGWNYLPRKTSLRPKKGRCKLSRLTKRRLAGWLICRRLGGFNTVFWIRARFLKLVAALVQKCGLWGMEGGLKGSRVGRRELSHLGSPVRRSDVE